MVRWEPGARDRLQEAALELFAEQGFEQTTAAEVARSVGLTERTFFRHFADKKEVLFHGQQKVFQAFVDPVVEAPQDASPVELIGAALASVAELFPDERRAASRTRQRVIDGNPALQERERHKLAGLATVVAEALRDRGIAEPAATLTAESAVTVFGIAFAEWIRQGDGAREDETRSLGEISAAVLAELQTVAGG